MTPLNTISADSVPSSSQFAFNSDALDTARRVIEDVQSAGWQAVVEWSLRLGDPAPLMIEKPELEQAFHSLDASDRKLMESAAARIETFSRAQRDCIRELDLPIPGGRAGHWLAPVGSVGCYAPGGRFPLPSSVLMTAIPARVAGVERVIVASPRPTVHTLAAAAIAGADQLVACGGAQAIAAMALGAGEIAPCNIIVGPGNRYVTAAKQLLSGIVGIDMLAGPSEVLIIADSSADARLIAADLLAQAEHDVDARALLVTDSTKVIEKVNQELIRQLADLPTADIARTSLAQSFAVQCSDIDQCIEVASRLAPEHLEVMTDDPESVAKQVRNFGAAFIGPYSAEVLGDYGAGPNHVLPTSGASCHSAGLSVFTFLRPRTWLNMDATLSATDIYNQSAAFARLEGLEAHARAAEARI